MSFLDVTIKGLAFCRPVPATNQKPAVTQVLFPHPPDHELDVIITKITTKGSEITTETLSEKLPATIFNTFMEMALEGDASFVDVPDGEELMKEIVDIVRLHKLRSVGGLQPTIIFRAKDQIQTEISYLSLPTAILLPGEVALLPYEFWSHKTKPEINPTERKRNYISDSPYGSLVEEIKVRFEIPNTEELSAVKLQMEKPFVRSYTFNYESAVNYSITFDNHCHSESCGSDFGYYYEMLKASDDSSFNVEIEEFPVHDRATADPDSEASCNPVIGDTGLDLGSWYAPSSSEE